MGCDFTSVNIDVKPYEYFLRGVQPNVQWWMYSNLGVNLLLVILLGVFPPHGFRCTIECIATMCCFVYTPD